MKSKRILILFSVLVFAGAVLLAHTPSWAGAPVTPCGERPDGSGGYLYTEAQEEGICLNIRNPSGDVVYVWRAVDMSGTYLEPAPPIGPGTGSYIGSGWPYQTGGTGPWNFAYEIGPSPAVYNRDIRVSAISYALTLLRGLPLPGSDPPGAQTDVTNIDPSCSVGPAPPSFLYYKWNASVNRSGSDTVTILSSSSAIDECGQAWILFRSDCDGGPLFLPLLGSPSLPFQGTIEYTCEDSGVTVEIQRDRCTGEFLAVECRGSDGSIIAGTGRTSTNYLHAVLEDPDNPGSIVESDLRIDNAGPTTPGCIICGDPFPFVVRDNDIWWCGTPPTTSGP